MERALDHQKRWIVKNDDNNITSSAQLPRLCARPLWQIKILTQVCLGHPAGFWVLPRMTDLIPVGPGHPPFQRRTSSVPGNRGSWAPQLPSQNSDCSRGVLTSTHLLSLWPGELTPPPGQRRVRFCLLPSCHSLLYLGMLKKKTKLLGNEL